MGHFHCEQFCLLSLDFGCVFRELFLVRLYMALLILTSFPVGLLIQSR